MRTIIPFFTALFLTSTTPLNAQVSDDVRWISPQPQGNALTRVVALNQNSVWAVGRQGAMVHSSDGGTTWSSMPCGDTHDLCGISFTSANVGWIVGDEGIILTSVTDGKAWELVASPVRTRLNDIAFLTATMAIVVGDFGVIMRTLDAGATWELVRNNDPRDYVRIVVNAKGEGVIAGSDGTLYRAEPFGPITPIAESLDPIADGTISFGDGTFVLLSSDAQPFVSVNRKTWDDLKPPEVPLSKRMPGLCIGAFDRNTLVIGASGSLLLTKNGAKTWNSLNGTMPQASILSMCIRDDSTAIAVGETGEIVLINVRSARVEPLNKMPFAGIKRAVFLDQDNAIVLTNSGSLLLTMNSGASWHPEGEQVVLSSLPLMGFFFVSQQNGFALTSESIIKTTTGGQTWEAIPFTLKLLPLAFGSFGRNEVWFSGNGYLAVSRGEGSSLTVLLASKPGDLFSNESGTSVRVTSDLPRNEYVRAFALTEPKSWFIITSGNQLYHSDNAGNDWDQIGRTGMGPDLVVPSAKGLLIISIQDRQVRLCADENLVSIGLLPKDTSALQFRASGKMPAPPPFPIKLSSSAIHSSPNTTWIGGTQGSLMKSTEYNTSWLRIQLPTDEDISAVTLLNEYDGWVATKQGSLYVTRDGGQSWELKSTQVPVQPTTLQFTTLNEGWLTTSKGEMYISRDEGVSWRRKRVSSGSVINDIAWDPSGVAWIASSRTLYSVTLPLGESLRSYPLPVTGNVTLLGTSADSAILFVSNLGEVGSIRTGEERPLLFPTRSPNTHVGSVSAGDRFHPVLLSREKLQYRWSDSTAWVPFVLKTENTINSVVFSSRSTGFILGNNGIMLQTKDGGVQWNEVPRPTLLNLAHLVSSSERNVMWLGGDQGTLLNSDRNGSLWRKLLLPLGTSIQGLQFLPPDQLFVYSNNGAIVRLNVFDIPVEEW